MNKIKLPNTISSTLFKQNKRNILNFRITTTTINNNIVEQEPKPINKTIIPIQPIITNNNKNIRYYSNNTNKPKSNMLYTPKERNYEEAVNALLSLQSNQSVIVSWTKERKNDKEGCAKLILEELIGYCKCLGIELDGKQSIIHVAGTKGKGSTCAITESIIRENGFTTLLFTSPHLISPRERIKINGEPISEHLFSNYFWLCWDTLIIDYQTQLPNFFKFLTLMTFKIFQDLKIQCAILEVGIGGRMDSTNVFKQPMVTGISALGYDHMNLLGDTLEEIALEKAGIMKQSVPIFTVGSQLPSAMNVLKQHSLQVGTAPLVIVPSLREYSLPTLDDNNISSSLQGEYQFENTALAIALSNCWLSQQSFKPLSNIFNNENYKSYDYKLNNYSSNQFTPLNKSFKIALQNCKWPGRAQHFSDPLNYPNIDFYLDGAHTPESSIVMLNWWKSIVSKDQQSQPSTSNNAPIDILIFNSTGGRNPNSFLKPIIQSIDNGEIPIFNHTIIPNIIIEKPIDKKYYIKELKSTETTTTATITPDKASTNTPTTTTTTTTTDTTTNTEETWEDFVVNCYDKLSNKSHPCISVNSIEESIEKIKQIQSQGSNSGQKVRVLITGSLYLVGGVLKVIQKHENH